MKKFLHSKPLVVVENNNMDDNKTQIVQNNPADELKLMGDETAQREPVDKSSNCINEGFKSENTSFDISNVQTHSQLIEHLCDQLYESNSFSLPPRINPSQFGTKYFILI